MMPFAPPATLTGAPVEHVLPAYSQLWRTHRGADTALRFDPPATDVFGGRRFDGTALSPHRCCYASFDRATAIAEEVLPSFDANPAAPRYLTRETLADLHLSAVRTTRDLPLLRLTSAPDLASVHAGSWLITERDGHYPAIRQWAGWLREQAEWAAGILWTSILDLPSTTLVLFEDRCAGALSPMPGLTSELGTPDAPDWLAETMSRWGVLTRPPRARRPRVFLNYRSGFADQMVLMLQNELTGRFGEDGVFRDITSMPFGERYEPVLLENARSVRVLLAIVGPNWEHARGAADTRCLDDPGDWVRREILHAREHGVRVVPVLVGPRNRLRAEDLPEPLAWLAAVPFMQLPGDAGTAEIGVFVDRLLRRCPDLDDDDED
jgi:hypothetical protein